MKGKAHSSLSTAAQNLRVAHQVVAALRVLVAAAAKEANVGDAITASNHVGRLDKVHALREVPRQRADRAERGGSVHEAGGVASKGTCALGRFYL